MPKKIKTWEELVGLENEKYKLEIDLFLGCGHIVPKDKSDGIPLYLSTHTFYGSNYKGMTKLLQEHGFDVELANWDAKK